MSEFQPGLVSIVMPAYNAAQYIASAIDSVIAQDYPHWELLVVNDGSKDGTADITTSYAARDERIRFINQRFNQGVARTRNCALEAARGEYIAFLDSDDLWMDDKLSKQVAFMERSGALISYAAYLRMDEHGRILGTVQPPPSVDHAGMLKSNVIGNLTGIYNAGVLGKQYFSGFKHEDYVAWLNLVKKAGVAYGLPDALAQYRVYANSTSANKLKTLGWQWRIYRQAEHLSMLKSCNLMMFYAYNALRKRM